MNATAQHSSLDVENLVRMANRIGDFFGAMPDAAEASEGIAGHIRKFWEPRMRQVLLAHVDAGGEGLQTIVLDAIRGHRGEL